MKNNFQILVEELRTDPIVFIDNDFSPVKEPSEIFEFIAFLNEGDYTLLNKLLNDLDPELANLFITSRQNLAGLNLDATDRDYLRSPAAAKHLSGKGSTDIAEEVDKILALIEKNLKNGDELADHAMNFGLVPDATYGSYAPFFDSLKQFEGSKSIRIYKGLLGEQFNLFKQNIEETLNIKEKEFYLMIVDKKLTGQEGDEIISDLRKGGGKTVNFFSVLFTSKEGEQLDPQNFDQYFQLQLTKHDPQVVNKVSGGLALCAYAKLFDMLRTAKKTVLDEAFDLITSDGKQNMLYLAEMAHAEGTTVFNVINKWFDLLAQKKITDALSGKHDQLPFDYSFVTSLTAFLNPDYIIAKPGVSENFEIEIQGLKTFELFDHSINELYLPPAPGDIYRIDTGLYILAGQECDLIVRGKGKDARRKEKLAELVKCSFSLLPIDGKTQDTESTLSLNHFLLDDKHGVLEIDFKKRSLYDFRILDLCSTNNTGRSILPTGGELEMAARKALPKAWENYCQRLFTELANKMKLLDFMKQEKINGGELLPDESFLLDHTTTGDSTNFPVQRIARLRGGFKEYFLQRYWQYKTRKGLDTIALYNQENAAIEYIECGFFENHEKVVMDEPLNVLLQLTGDHEKNRDKGKLALILSKTELSRFLNEQQRKIFDFIAAEDIRLANQEYKEESSKIIFRKKYEDGKLSLAITFPIYNEITGNYFVVKNSMTLNHMFEPSFINTSQIPDDAHYLSGGEQFPLYENNKLKKLKLADIENGIYIPSIKLAFKVERNEGVLRKTELPVVEEEAK